ncbi:MAG: hypothetical protein K2N25_05565 [Muribaculaceae bacterium]|nr:hypothetical protein [Muribaculaceae bacterium]
MKISRNPYSGRNCTGYRFRFQVSSISHQPLFLPLEMKSLPQIRMLLQGISPLAAFNCFSHERALEAFSSIRKKYDFDYWAINEYFIHDLTDADSIIPLRLNDAQFLVIDTFRKRFFDRMPSRYIITKSFRRCGLSTCIQAYILWMQTFQCSNNSYTCSPSEISMFPLKANLCRYLHRDIVPPDMGIFLPRVDGRAFFNTFRNPDAIRGINLGYVHLADMSRWRDSKLKKTERAYIAPVSAVLFKFFTLVVLEGDVPWKCSFNIKDFVRRDPHMRETNRKNKLSKKFHNPFFINEVMVAQSSHSPYFFHLHLGHYLRFYDNSFIQSSRR